MAGLFIECLLNHRSQNRFEIHAFVVMRDHIHVLLTPGEDITLERAAQFAKGTFSHRAKKELGFAGKVWNEGYYDERIRSAEHCRKVIEYIENNPVVRGLSCMPKEFPFGSACGRWESDPVPEWLRPSFACLSG
jgi:putative transposase